MKSSFANNECSSFIFEENHVEGETTQSNNVVTVEEELDGIDIDGIGNLLDLLIGIIWIYLCSSMKNVGIVDGSLFIDDSLQEIMTERGSQKFYKPIYICPLFGKCYEGDWGKYDVSCGYIFRG